MSWFIFRKKGQTERPESPHFFRAVLLAAALLFSAAGAGISGAEEKPGAQPAAATGSVPAAQPDPVAPQPAQSASQPAQPLPAAPVVPAVRPAPAAPPQAQPMPEDPVWQPEPVVPPPVKVVPPEAPPEPLEKRLEKKMDETHERLQRNILDRIVRLDDFFGNTKTENQRLTEYQFRLRSSIRGETSGKYQYGPSLRATILLPRISERLRLTIAGDNEPTQATPTLPEDPGNPGFDRTVTNAKLVNTELRYTLIKSPSMDLFMGAGVRLVLPPQGFVRSRLQYTYHLSDISLVRFGETFFVRNPDGPGVTSEFDLERFLDEKTLLRWSSVGTAAYGIQGVELGSELSMIREISRLSAITVMGGVYGNSSRDDTITNFRLLTRYRRNFMRKWLFFEVEPEFFWPRVGEQYPINFAFTLRLEVVFEGTAAAK